MTTETPLKIKLRGKLKSTLPNLALVAASASICIFLAEYALRVFPQDNDNIPVSITGSKFSTYIMKPYQKATSLHGKKYEINSLGLRDKEINRPFGEIFALVAGDSQAMGYGIQEHERFSNIISETISRSPSAMQGFGCSSCKSQRVLNAAVSGYQAIDNVGMIDHLLGLGIRPRLLIVGINSTDFSSPLNWNIVNGSQVSGHSKLLPPRIEAFLKGILRNSALYQFVGNNVKRIMIQQSKANTPEAQDALSNQERLSEIQEIQLAAYTGFSQRFSRLHPSTPFVYVYIPSARELDGRSFGLPSKMLQEDTKKYSCALFIDGRQDLINSGSSIKELYALNDFAHPSYLGHRVIAESIQSRLPRLFKSCKS